MAKDILTDEDVEREIERLSKSPAVQVARVEQRIKNRRRQYMYQLRGYEKRGLQLLAEGVTVESLKRMDVDIDNEGCERT